MPRKAKTDAPTSVIDEQAPYPYDKRMKRKKYERTLLALQGELVKAQRWAKASGERIVIVFEGRDAAGKGGTIKRFLEHMNPRGARVVALSKPNETERGEWYFQRYVRHLPTAGEFVFFDRSWYNRAGVEPVMGFCTRAEHDEFLRQTAPFEHALVETGIRLFKLWFLVGRDEQRKRFDARMEDPLKQWKLSPVDFASMNRWGEYTVARDYMFTRTHTEHAPWTVLRSDDKRRARIAAIQWVLTNLDYEGRDESVLERPDPLVCGLPEVDDPSRSVMDGVFPEAPLL